MLTIATWNVNSVRTRLTQLVDYLRNSAPDVVLLQELKCVTENFPYLEIEDLGYNVAVHGQKTYNGVAILAKHPIEDVTKQLPSYLEDDQARYIEAVISLKHQAVRVASIYVPNGQEAGSEKFSYKLKFLEELAAHTKDLLRYDEVLVLGGDYNVAPAPVDVFDPKGLEGSVCFHPEERERFRALLNLGLTDAYRALYPNGHQYSWWDYRGSSWDYNKGMRIDHLLLSPQAADRCRKVEMVTELRGQEKASDHVPVVVGLEL